MPLMINDITGEYHFQLLEQSPQVIPLYIRKNRLLLARTFNRRYTPAISTFQLLGQWTLDMPLMIADITGDYHFQMFEK